jgi:hypothetical protein
MIVDKILIQRGLRDGSIHRGSVLQGPDRLIALEEEDWLLLERILGENPRILGGRARPQFIRPMLRVAAVEGST